MKKFTCVADIGDLTTAVAEAMEIKSEALPKNKGLTEYEAVQKWDGKLPQYMLGGATPFINLNK